jgi:hypothetical protein
MYECALCTVLSLRYILFNYFSLYTYHEVKIPRNFKPCHAIHRAPTLSPLSLLVAKSGKNHLNEEITPTPQSMGPETSLVDSLLPWSISGLHLCMHT